MFTLSELGGLALLTGLAFAVFAAWLTFMLCNNHLWNVITPLQAQVDAAAAAEFEQVVVTVYSAEDDTFIETRRYDDVYTALVYMHTHSIMYNLRLKVQKRSGEYIILNVINS